MRKNSIFVLLKSGMRCGFSLVEVMLAMSIILFALLPLLGLTAVGLGGLQSAMDKTVQSSIVYDMRTRAAEITNVSLNIGDSFYLDDGTPVEQSDPRARYRATLHSPSTNLLETGSLPRTIALQFDIVHISTSQVRGAGVIHVTTRQ